MFAKAMSCRAMFISSTRMTSLMDTMIKKLGFVRESKDVETHLQPVMTPSNLIDELYGDDLRKLES